MKITKKLQKFFDANEAAIKKHNLDISKLRIANKFEIDLSSMSDEEIAKFDSDSDKEYHAEFYWDNGGDSCFVDEEELKQLIADGHTDDQDSCFNVEAIRVKDSARIDYDVKMVVTLRIPEIKDKTAKPRKAVKLPAKKAVKK